MMGSCRNPKRQANKALVSAIVSPSSRQLPGTRLFASIRSSLKSDFGRSAAELLFDNINRAVTGKLRVGDTIFVLCAGSLPVSTSFWDIAEIWKNLKHLTDPRNTLSL
ncbi:hypothetical protein SprV_0200539300 [Sparganum proliferum]